MPRNKDPAVLFYTSDFLVGCMGLTMEERGQYITLLCLQHQKGHLTHKEIELAVGKCSSDVLSKFEVDADGKYYNDIMEQSAKQREAYVESRRKSIRARWDNKRTSHEDTYEDTYVIRGENENENINENINSIEDDKGIIIAETNKEGAHARNEVPQRVKKQPQKPKNEVDEVERRFTRFWERYPKKVAKVDARKAFTRLDPDDDLLGVMLAALERQKASEGWTKEGGRYIPYPATWINQRRWEDEEPPTAKVIPKYSDFDVNEALELALARTFNGGSE